MSRFSLAAVVPARKGGQMEQTKRLKRSPKEISSDSFDGGRGDRIRTCDLSPRRPLYELIELIAASPGFVISFSCHSRGAGRKNFRMKQDPRNAVLCCFRFTIVVAPETIFEILTGTDVAATSFPAPQNINTKHTESRAVAGGMVGVTGFEPATSWSQTRRSTKLSYTPNFPDAYHALPRPACRNFCRAHVLPILV